MKNLVFNSRLCVSCGVCAENCPFDAIKISDGYPVIGAGCRMCGLCVRNCPSKALTIEEKADEAVDKSQWRDFLIYAEQEAGEIHPVTFELIGEALKMAPTAGFCVNCVIAGAEGTLNNAEKLLEYGVSTVYAYEDPALEGLVADVYANVVSDCISRIKPSSVLIGGTAFGRSLAPRLATRFSTGLTADCTTLGISENTDMLQIRPAFGGNVMAQILITKTRPQFATVRYRVMDRAAKVEPFGRVEACRVTDSMKVSGQRVISIKPIEKKEAIEDAEIIVAAGRGAAAPESLELCRKLAQVLGGKLGFSRPMVEAGVGDPSMQIGLSGHTVKPRLIITCGVSGAIQFASCMKGADTIVAINTDRNAPIFSIAHYCLVGDVARILPELIENIQKGREE